MTHSPIAFNDEELALQRGQRMFETDVARTVRVITERHRAKNSLLTTSTLHAIFEEAFADMGLASRRPSERLEALKATLAVDEDLSFDASEKISLIRQVVEAFGHLPDQAQLTRNRKRN